MLWYNHGKPSADRLHALIVAENIKEFLSGEIPTLSTVKNWVKTTFQAKATFLDNEAMKSIEKGLVGNKIETLRKHAEIGKELYEMGMQELRENGLGNARNALTAVIEGMRIENESSGAAIKFTELSKMSDEELVGELHKLVSGSKIISIEPNDE